MTTQEILHNLRNPYGKSPAEIERTRHAAADKIEELEKQLKSASDAYVNMRDFARSAGLDTTTYGKGEIGILKSPICGDRNCPLHGDHPNTCVAQPTCPHGVSLQIWDGIG